MIGRIALGLTTGVMLGVAVSSFKHYYNRYAEDMDRVLLERREVIIVEDQTKKTRGRK